MQMSYKNDINITPFASCVQTALVISVGKSECGASECINLKIGTNKKRGSGDLQCKTEAKRQVKSHFRPQLHGIALLCHRPVRVNISTVQIAFGRRENLFLFEPLSRHTPRLASPRFHERNTRVNRGRTMNQKDGQFVLVCKFTLAFRSANKTS